MSRRYTSEQFEARLQAAEEKVKELRRAASERAKASRQRQDAEIARAAREWAASAGIAPDGIVQALRDMTQHEARARFPEGGAGGNAPAI